MGLTITCTNGFKLFASASDALGTTTSDSSGNSTITVACGSYSPKVRYLTTPTGNKRFPNSIAIEIKWNNNDTLHQEVFVMVDNKKINSVTWKQGNTTITQSSGWTDLSTSSTLFVTIGQENSTTPHSGITNLALYQYYVSKKGYTWNGDGNVVTSNASVGSWNTPGKARHRATSTAGNFTDKYFDKEFSFTPPSEKPNYYIMVAYKGWKAGIGHIMILEGKANSLIDKNAYWDGGWHEYIRYSFYAVYNDGVAPSLSSDATIADKNRTGTSQTTTAYNRDTATATAMWVKFDNPPTLYDIGWYRTFGTNAITPLVDGNKQALLYKAVKDTKIIIPEWDYPNNYNSQHSTSPESEASYHFKGWYYKQGDPSPALSAWSGTATSPTISKMKVPATTINFRLSLEINSYNIIYNSSVEEIKTVERGYGTSLKIDPFGNLPTGTAKHKDPITGSNHNCSNNNGYTITVIQNLTIENPTTTEDYTFIGWTLDSNTLTAKWLRNNVNVTYYKGTGAGGSSPITITAPYDKPYYVLAPDSEELNFTAPSGKHFVHWHCSNGKDYAVGGGPGRGYMKSDITLTAIWGSPWKKVKYIWIYDDTTNSWKGYKPWVNI